MLAALRAHPRDRDPSERRRQSRRHQHQPCERHAATICAAMQNAPAHASKGRGAFANAQPNRPRPATVALQSTSPPRNAQLDARPPE